jgi:phosphate transport system permease protein
LFSFIALIPFLSIIWTLLKKGLIHVNPNFYTQTSPSATEAILANLSGEIIPGGILNGICGSLYILLITIILTVPLGFFIGVYIHENRKQKFSIFIQYISAIFYGMPSIIIGITVYVFIVKSFHSFSAWAGSVALSVLMLPMIIRATDETLKSLPTYLKESGLALGASYTSVILRVIIPTAKGNLLTGLLISVSRILGVTAPLIVTTLGCSMVNWDITKPTSSITLLIWNFSNNPCMADMVWSTSLFLFIFIIVLNIIAKHIAWKWKITLPHE